MGHSMLRAVAVALGSALVVAGPACKGDRGPPGPAAAQNTVGPPSDEFAPNLNVALTAARVTADRKVQVDYTLSDPSGAGIGSANDVTGSWTLARLTTDPASNLPAWQSLILKAGVGGLKGTTDQPTSETSGTVENLGGGSYRYTYATVLPDGFDAGATYRAAVFARRPIPNTSGLMDVANGIIDFVPRGGTPQQHDLVSTQACNACHTQLRAHGGFRRETRLCATCHTTQLVDPDTNDTGDPTQLNPLDFGRMIHRIHRGKDLPTVDAAAAAGDTTWAYHVIGFGNSDQVYGQVIPNPDPAAARTTPVITAGVAFPRDLRGCGVCHSPAKDAQGNVLYGGQADEWKTSVSRRTCQSCHDSTWFKDGAPPTYHVIHQQATNPTVPAGTNPPTPAGVTPAGLVQTDDSQCKTCHSDVLMAQHHTSPFASPDFDAITLKINSASAAPAGGGTPATAAAPGTVVVNFSASNKDGSPITDLATLSSLSLNVTGPTVPDFSGSGTDGNIVNVNARTAAAAVAGAPGTYTVTAAIPAGASGTWAAGLEARRTSVPLTAQERKLGHLGPTATFNEFAINPVAYFNVSGTGTPVKRRQVVAFEKCNACHETLSVHGGTRHDPQYCVMCHTPDNTDIGRRPTLATPPPARITAADIDVGKTLDKLVERSIHLKPMIHSIHTGEELQTQRPFVIYGFGGSVNFFDEVRFPSSRANCSLCHVGTTYTLDSLPENALPTRAFQIGPATPSTSGTLPVATGGRTSCGPAGPGAAPGCVPVGPITVTCVACHDSPEAHAHAQAMTQVPFAGSTDAPVETCRVCHGENRDLAVTRVHAQAASRGPE